MAENVKLKIGLRTAMKYYLTSIMLRISSHHLSFTGTVLVQFDAHFDLLSLMYRLMTATKKVLFKVILIGDWILPVVYPSASSGTRWARLAGSLLYYFIIYGLNAYTIGLRPFTVFISYYIPVII